MQNNKEWKKAIRKLSKQISVNHSFILYEPTFLLKPVCDIALIICFDFPPTAMKLHMAAQPLYLPDKNPHLTFGRELVRTNVKANGYWGKNFEKQEEEIKELEILVEKEILPFFDKISSPQKLVDFLESDESYDLRIVRCPPAIRFSYLAYSYLRLCNFTAAKHSFEDLIDELSMYTDSSSKKSANTANAFIQLINEGKTSTIDTILNDNILSFYDACGL